MLCDKNKDGGGGGDGLNWLLTPTLILIDRAELSRSEREGVGKLREKLLVMQGPQTATDPGNPSGPPVLCPKGALEP